MEYKFSNKIHGEKGIFGVVYESLNTEHKALFEINSDMWTSEEIQNIIDSANSLTSNEEFEYQVEGGHLYIIVDSQDAYFYNTLNDEIKEEDFKIPFSDFITFMTDFKQFIEENS